MVLGSKLKGPQAPCVANDHLFLRPHDFADPARGQTDLWLWSTLRIGGVSITSCHQGCGIGRWVDSHSSDIRT